MEKNTQFKKNFLWNILGTSLNAFTSLFYMIIVTRVNGVDNAGIFTIAFSTACILYVIGIYAGRIYQVTEPNKEITDKDYIINRLLSIFLMILFVILFCLIKKYTILKSIIFILLTIFKSIEAFSEVIYGILQKNEKLEIVGKSLCLKSICSVLIFAITDIITQNMAISIVSIIIIWIVILFTYDIKNSKEYIDFSGKVNIQNVNKIFKSGFFTFAISFLGLYILNAPKYAVMPATVIGLVAQFLIHPYLNQILDFYNKKDMKNLNKLIMKLIYMILGFGAISSLLAYFLGPEVLGLIYGIDLNSYRVGLLIIIISATLYTIGVIYSSILITIRETFSQFIIYIIVAIFALITSNICTKLNNINGAIVAYFMIMSLQFLSYFIYTNIKLKKISV